MKVDELRKVLKALIREEVKKAVAEEVSRAMGKVLVEMVKEIKKPTAQPINESVEEEEEMESPIHTNNPKLNSVLAQTARNFKPLQKTADATMGLAALMEGGDFEKIGRTENTGVEAPATKIDFLKSMVSPGVPQQPSVLDNGGAAVPDVLKSVFKKDFRAVMKKIDEQKKNGSPGMINMGQVIQG